MKIMKQDQCSWTQVQCNGDEPLGRMFHSAVEISKNQMLVFGGMYNSKLKFNDTYILKISTQFVWS